MALWIVALICALVVGGSAHQTELGLGDVSFLLQPFWSMSNHAVKRDVSSSCDAFRITNTLNSQCNLLNTFGGGLTESKLNSFCRNLECNIQCFTDAIGDCYKEDVMFAWEPEPNRVFSRAMCDNVPDTVSLFNDCLMITSKHCLIDFAETLVYELVPLVERGQYTTYRERYCSSISTLLSCVRYHGCTRAVAHFGRRALKAGFSFSKCGYSHTGHLFAKYGGPPMCGLDDGPAATASPPYKGLDDGPATTARPPIKVKSQNPTQRRYEVYVIDESTANKAYRIQSALCLMLLVIYTF